MTLDAMVTIFFLASVSCILQIAGAVNFVPVGCYKNKVKGNPSRALPVLVHNYRWPRGQPEFDWNNLNKTVEACAREVRARGFLYFGIQFYGECWSGPQSHVTYDDGGPSTRCTSAGVGQALANFVYRLTGEENECSDYEEMNEADRAQTSGRGHNCDFWGSFQHRWYRISGDAGTAMPEKCVAAQRCGTENPGWLQTPHPTPTEGIQPAKICFSKRGKGCCYHSYQAHVRNCGNFYVYKMKAPGRCFYRHCGNGITQ